MLIQKTLNFFMQTDIFKHIFELLLGLPNVPHILGCQSVTSRGRASYHTPNERGYPELSYGPNSFNISGVIRELQLGETFKFPVPRIKVGVILVRSLATCMMQFATSSCSQ